MEKNIIYQGDSIESIKQLPDESVDCVVTSPPYYGLRDYGTGEWVGGDPNCKHYRESKKSDKTITEHKRMQENDAPVGDAIYKTVCPICGAVRVDKQIGLEETPEQYIQRLVELFREIRRVLKKDGTIWVNIGDTYFAHNGSRGCKSKGGDTLRGRENDYQPAPKYRSESGCKTKDLIGIPWMLAFALRADGWYLRQDIIWHKPNPMPESVRDRCTKAHEYIFLLSKSRHYYFDSESIAEPVADATVKRMDQDIDAQKGSVWPGYGAPLKAKAPRYGGKKYTGTPDKFYRTKSGNAYQFRAKRNKRDVWTVSTKAYKEAHFATFPEELIAPCILAGCREKGIVLDPFMGSGTTGIVARKLNRNYIGCELNPDYVEMAERRISEHGENLFNQ